MSDQHRIDELVFDLTFESTAFARQEQGGLEAWIAGQLLPAMDELFDTLAGGTTLWRFDTIELDLGSVAPEHYQRDIAIRLQEQLANLLQHQLNQPTAGPAAIEHLRTFLEQGQLALPVAAQHQDAHQRLLDQALQDDAPAVITLLRTVRNSDNVLHRLTQQFSEAQRVRVLRALAPAQLPLLLDLLDMLELLPDTPAASAWQGIWAAIFAQLLPTPQVDDTALVARLLPTTAAVLHTTTPTLARQLRQAVQPWSAQRSGLAQALEHWLTRHTAGAAETNLGLTGSFTGAGTASVTPGAKATTSVTASAYAPGSVASATTPEQPTHPADKGGQTPADLGAAYLPQIRTLLEQNPFFTASERQQALAMMVAAAERDTQALVVYQSVLTQLQVQPALNPAALNRLLATTAAQPLSSVQTAKPVAIPTAPTDTEFPTGRLLNTTQLRQALARALIDVDARALRRIWPQLSRQPELLRQAAEHYLIDPGIRQQLMAGFDIDQLLDLSDALVPEAGTLLRRLFSHAATLRAVEAAQRSSDVENWQRQVWEHSIGLLLHGGESGFQRQQFVATLIQHQAAGDSQRELELRAVWQQALAEPLPADAARPPENDAMAATSPAATHVDGDEILPASELWQLLRSGRRTVATLQLSADRWRLLWHCIVQQLPPAAQGSPMTEGQLLIRGYANTATPNRYRDQVEQLLQELNMGPAAELPVPTLPGDATSGGMAAETPLASVPTARQHAPPSDGTIPSLLANSENATAQLPIALEPLAIPQAPALSQAAVPNSDQTAPSLPPDTRGMPPQPGEWRRGAAPEPSDDASESATSASPVRHDTIEDGRFAASDGNGATSPKYIPISPPAPADNGQAADSGEAYQPGGPSRHAVADKAAPPSADNPSASISVASGPRTSLADGSAATINDTVDLSATLRKPVTPTGQAAELREAQSLASNAGPGKAQTTTQPTSPAPTTASRSQPLALTSAAVLSADLRQRYLLCEQFQQKLQNLAQLRLNASAWQRLVVAFVTLAPNLAAASRADLLRSITAVAESAPDRGGYYRQVLDQLLHHQALDLETIAATARPRPQPASPQQTLPPRTEAPSPQQQRQNLAQALLQAEFSRIADLWPGLVQTEKELLRTAALHYLVHPDVRQQLMARFPLPPLLDMVAALATEAGLQLQALFEQADSLRELEIPGRSTDADNWRRQLWESSVSHLLLTQEQDFDREQHLAALIAHHAAGDPDRAANIATRWRMLLQLPPVDTALHAADELLPQLLRYFQMPPSAGTALALKPQIEQLARHPQQLAALYLHLRNEQAYLSARLDAASWQTLVNHRLAQEYGRQASTGTVLALAIDEHAALAMDAAAYYREVLRTLLYGEQLALEAVLQNVALPPTIEAPAQAEPPVIASDTPAQPSLPAATSPAIFDANALYALIATHITVHWSAEQGADFMAAVDLACAMEGRRLPILQQIWLGLSKGSVIDLEAIAQSAPEQITAVADHASVGEAIDAATGLGPMAPPLAESMATTAGKAQPSVAPISSHPFDPINSPFLRSNTAADASAVPPAPPPVIAADSSAPPRADPVVPTAAGMVAAPQASSRKVPDLTPPVVSGTGGEPDEPGAQFIPVAAAKPGVPADVENAPRVSGRPHAQADAAAEPLTGLPPAAEADMVKTATPALPLIAADYSAPQMSSHTGPELAPASTAGSGDHPPPGPAAEPMSGSATKPRTSAEAKHVPTVSSRPTAQDDAAAAAAPDTPQAAATPAADVVESATLPSAPTATSSDENPADPVGTASVATNAASQPAVDSAGIPRLSRTAELSPTPPMPSSASGATRIEPASFTSDSAGESAQILQSAAAQAPLAIPATAVPPPFAATSGMDGPAIGHPGMGDAVAAAADLPTMPSTSVGVPASDEHGGLPVSPAAGNLNPASTAKNVPSPGKPSPLTPQSEHPQTESTAEAASAPTNTPAREQQPAPSANAHAASQNNSNVPPAPASSAGAAISTGNNTPESPVATDGASRPPPLNLAGASAEQLLLWCQQLRQEHPPFDLHLLRAEDWQLLLHGFIRHSPSLERLNRGALRAMLDQRIAAGDGDSRSQLLRLLRGEIPQTGNLAPDTHPSDLLTPLRLRQYLAQMLTQADFNVVAELWPKLLNEHRALLQQALLHYLRRPELRQQLMARFPPERLLDLLEVMQPAAAQWLRQLLPHADLLHQLEGRSSGEDGGSAGDAQDWQRRLWESSISELLREPDMAFDLKRHVQSLLQHHSGGDQRRRQAMAAVWFDIMDLHARATVSDMAAATASGADSADITLNTSGDTMAPAFEQLWQHWRAGLPLASATNLLQHIATHSPQQLGAIYEALRDGVLPFTWSALTSQDWRALVHVWLSQQGGAAEFLQAIDEYGSRASTPARMYQGVLQQLLHAQEVDLEALAQGDMPATPLGSSASAAEPGPIAKELAVLLKTAMNERSQALVSQLLAGGAEELAALRALLANRQTALRLGQGLPAATVSRLLEEYFPEQQQALQRTAHIVADAIDLLTQGRDLVAIASFVRQFTVEYLFAENASDNIQAFARALTQALVRDRQLPDTRAAQQLVERRLALLQPGASAAAPRPKPGQTTEPEPPLLLEGLPLPNAGLVLAGPYLPRLFSMLGLTVDGEFSDLGKARRAAYLLQFLVFGHTEAPEYQLLLNKILCGIGTAIPLGLPVELSDHEKQTAEQLLQGMIQNWSIIGKTSIQGLRETFLQRQGWLSQVDDTWQLNVQPGTFDMLLYKLPWGFSVLKYRWMDKPLHVEWRYGGQ